MTLAEADKKITPILKSGLLKKDAELQRKMEEVEKYLTGYEIKNPLKLTQTELLDDETNEAINSLLAYYKELGE